MYSQPTLHEIIEDIKNGKLKEEIMIFDTTLHSHSYYPPGNENYTSQIKKKKEELEELLHVLLEFNPGNVKVSMIIVHPSLQRENNRVADDPQLRAPEELRPLFYKIQRADKLKSEANTKNQSHSHDKYTVTKKIILSGSMGYIVFGGAMEPTHREDFRIFNNGCGDRFGVVSKNITFDVQCINQHLFPVNKSDCILLCPNSQKDLEDLLKTIETWKKASSGCSPEIGIAKLSTEKFSDPTGQVSFIINRDQERGAFLADLEAKIPSLAKTQLAQPSNSLNNIGIFGTRKSTAIMAASAVIGTGAALYLMCKQ
jgi:hypothetical protein